MKTSFYYPFSSEPEDYSEIPNHPWENSLDETCRGTDGIYRSPGFDLAGVVGSTAVPIVEIGGPTGMGYSFLQDVPLPVRPLITNIEIDVLDDEDIYPDRGVAMPTIDMLMDARSLPFRAESLGMVVGSCISRIILSQVREQAGDKWKDRGARMDLIVEAVDEIYGVAKLAAHSGDYDCLDACTDSPRISTIIQSERALKPGGLLLLANVVADDVVIARAAGLETVMHTPMYIDTLLESSYVESVLDEIVFRKPLATA